MNNAVEGIVILGGATLVNGSLVTDLTTAGCSNVAGLACKSSNPLQTSCSSSDWLAPSVPTGWNYQTMCCADYSAKCLTKSGLDRQSMARQRTTGLICLNQSHRDRNFGSLLRIAKQRCRSCIMLNPSV